MNETWYYIDCDWEPLIRLGEFKFGSSVDTYVKIGQLNFEPSDSDTIGWEKYCTPDDKVVVYAKDGYIISIHCGNECHFRGRNLIGMSFDEVTTLLDVHPTEHWVEEMIGEPQDVYDFAKLDAQIWVRSGTVVTVIVGNDPGD